MADVLYILASYWGKYAPWPPPWLFGFMIGFSAPCIMAKVRRGERGIPAVVVACVAILLTYVIASVIFLQVTK